jgi:hypothetical protein
MQLMQADMERAGVMPARADTIRSLARAVAGGRIVLDARADVSATVAALLAVPGIGTWTAEYVAMRALGEPDAFPQRRSRAAADGGRPQCACARSPIRCVATVAFVRGHAALGSGNAC